MGSETLHEQSNDLREVTINAHRAITSLVEELEAWDWYDQRVDACKDDGLRAILAHNRDEEKEHAAMLIEWLRRNDEAFAGELKDYLFTDESISKLEEGS